MARRAARDAQDASRVRVTLPGADHALALGCALLLAYRSLSRPSLRPAAWAVVAFCGLDAARLAGLPGMADVVAFVCMPACWGALLVVGCQEKARRR
jgi:hypothetical protein